MTRHVDEDWQLGRAIGSLARMDRMLAAGLATAVVAVVFTLIAPGRALAHPLIDDARRAYNATQHDAGLELLDRAEAGTDLSAEELAELLLLRAMMHRAQRRMDLAEIDLLRLAGLDPTRELGREVHPTLRRLFDTVRQRVPGPVRLDVTAERRGGVVHVRVAVTDDVAALTQGFRLHARAERGEWRDTDASSLEVDVRPSQAAEYWAEAVGPGGAVIATHGSRSAPSRLEPEAGAIAVDVEPDPVATAPGTTAPVDGGTQPGGEEIPAWPFIVGGVALAVGAAILIGVLVTQPTDETQLARPTVEALVSTPLPLLRFD